MLKPRNNLRITRGHFDIRPDLDNPDTRLYVRYRDPSHGWAFLRIGQDEAIDLATGLADWLEARREVDR